LSGASLAITSSITNAFNANPAGVIKAGNGR
jgi:hypothetical protein